MITTTMISIFIVVCVFYVTVVTFSRTLLLNMYTILSWMIDIWMKSIPIIETKFA